MKIGIIGCGTVSEIIVNNLDLLDNVKLVALYDKDYEKALTLSKISNAIPYKNFHEFIKQDFKICIEAASIEAVKKYAEKVIENNKDLVILSVGALLDEDFRKRISEKLKIYGRKIYIPSGAIGGLDVLKAISLSNVRKIKLRTIKNSRAFNSNSSGKIFEGDLYEAINRYPRNVNITASIYLVLNRRFNVEILSENIEKNVHELFVESDACDLYLKLENKPSKNYRTSYIAGLSVIALLKSLNENIIIGT